MRCKGGFAVAALLALAAAPARADEPPAAAVPDASWRAMLNRAVIVVLADGGQVAGTLLAVEEQTVTLIADGTGEVLTLDKAAVAALRAPLPPPVAPPPVPPPVPPPPPLPPPRDRFVGIHTGFFPLAITVDAQVGRFYGFLSYNPVFTIAASGDNWSAVAGAGFTHHFGRRKEWSVDVFALVEGALYMHAGFYGDETWYGGALGVGAGIRRIWHPSGFEMAIHVPVLGFALGTHGYQDGGWDHLSVFYLNAIASMPLYSVGWRF